jgi:hypothetical protein
MKTILIILSCVLFFIGCSSNKKDVPMELKEVSANFDLKNIEPFLNRITPLVQSGFSTEQISQILKGVVELKKDQEKKFEYRITYQNKSMPLKIKVVMDDLDSPLVYLFSEPVLADRINDEMHKFFQEKGL